MNNSQQSPAQLGHRPVLDGLRGVAVLAVIGLHGFPELMPGGGAGVDIFFALSGFLITCLLVEEYASTNRLRLGQFYMRRCLRLVPAFVCLLAVYVAYCLACYEDWQRKAGMAGGMVSLAYLSNWCRAFQWLPLYGLNHTWSLAIEEQFYLVWPVMLLLILSVLKSQKRALYAVLALIVFFTLHRALLMHRGTPLCRLYNGLDTRADALLAGCAAALIFKNYPIGFATRGARLLGGAACGCFVLLVAYFLWGRDWEEPALYYGGYSMLSLSAAVVILGLAYGLPGTAMLCWLLKLRTLVWAGKVSYGLYLWHFFIFFVCSEQFAHLPGWVVTSGAILTTLAVTALSFYLVEKPILRLKSRFAWQAQPTLPTAPAQVAA